jgi:hypothetical protein
VLLSGVQRGYRPSPWLTEQLTQVHAVDHYMTLQNPARTQDVLQVNAVIAVGASPKAGFRVRFASASSFVEARVRGFGRSRPRTF